MIVDLQNLGSGIYRCRVTMSGISACWFTLGNNPKLAYRNAYRQARKALGIAGF